MDDDIDLKDIKPNDEDYDAVFADAEEAPQIAGIIDERGPVDFADKRKWKIIEKDDEEAKTGYIILNTSSFCQYYKIF